MPRKQVTRIKKAAKKLGINGSEFIRQAVMEQVEIVEQKKTPSVQRRDVKEEWEEFKRERAEILSAMKRRDVDHDAFNMAKKTPVAAPPEEPRKQGIQRGFLIDKLVGVFGEGSGRGATATAAAGGESTSSEAGTATTTPLPSE